MRKHSLFLIFSIFFLLVLPFASSVETSFVIHNEKTLVKHSFENISSLELEVPYDVEEIKSNKEYTLEEFDSYKIIKFNECESLSIEYITETMVDKYGNVFYFVYQNNLDQHQEIKLVLPDYSYLVEDGIVFPKSDEITSDGINIILKWENLEEDEIVVNYESVQKNGIEFYITLFLFLLLIIFVIWKNFSKKSKSKNFMKNLLSDEKKIVEYLFNKKDKEAWTKDLVRDLGISKVKLSRKLRSLEQKEIIKKIPYGNENKIRLNKD